MTLLLEKPVPPALLEDKEALWYHLTPYWSYTVPAEKAEEELVEVPSVGTATFEPPEIEVLLALGLPFQPLEEVDLVDEPSPLQEP